MFMNTLVALPLVASPISAPAFAEMSDRRTPQVDPIFALLEVHRIAYEKMEEADRQRAIVERELNASGDLFPKVTSRGNPASGLPQPVSRDHAQIDMYSPRDVYPEDNAREHAELRAAEARREARLTPAENAQEAAWEDARIALEDLCETIPTTMSGVQALLSFRRTMWEKDRDWLDPYTLPYLDEVIEQSSKSYFDLEADIIKNYREATPEIKAQVMEVLRAADRTRRSQEGKA
jgi:hypothetical protein